MVGIVQYKIKSDYRDIDILLAIAVVIEVLAEPEMRQMCLRSGPYSYERTWLFTVNIPVRPAPQQVFLLS